MSSSRLVRGAKTRMFAFVCLISVLGAVLYVFHGTQARLAEVQSQASQCNQQKESFNAQLQVIHEYKERLEKSLYKEKDDRKLDKENHERELNEAKEKSERETLELKNKYEALDQKSKLLQAQLEDQKEASDKALTKVQNDNNNLETALAETKKLLEEAQAKLKESENSELKDKFIIQKEELKSCRKEVEDLKLRLAPESERKDYLTKQNEQLQAELDAAKHEVAQCKDKLTLVPKSESSSPRNDRIEPPESNIHMPKLMGKNISPTPVINPDAVGESSSLKPVKDQELKKEESRVGLAPKKPTQESVAPLAQPKRFDDNPPPQGQAQIPMPGGPRDDNPEGKKPVAEETNDLSNINLEESDDLVHQQEAKAQLQQPQFINPAIDPNRAEEEEEQQPGVPFKQPGRNPDHYHGGDYDKEQAEEEDDEGEQIDYEGERSMKEGRPRMRAHPGKLVESRGVMINPK